jgi:diacylglycerol kinase family enzyme
MASEAKSERGRTGKKKRRAGVFVARYRGAAQLAKAQRLEREQRAKGKARQGERSKLCEDEERRDNGEGRGERLRDGGTPLT